MRYTRNYKLKKDKGNQRGNSIQGPFTTLEQVLKRVPVNVGFNIECKYPMIDECEQEEMDFLNVELNWWVDTGIFRFPLFPFPRFGLFVSQFC